MRMWQGIDGHVKFTLIQEGFIESSTGKESDCNILR